MPKTRKYNRKQKGGEVTCPAGMPPRLCESYKKRATRRVMNRELQTNIKHAARWRNFRRLPEEERIARLKAYWNEEYVPSRQALRKNNNNNLKNKNTENVHAYTNADLL